jgi:hypothetical protein
VVNCIATPNAVSSLHEARIKRKYLISSQQLQPHQQIEWIEKLYKVIETKPLALFLTDSKHLVKRTKYMFFSRNTFLKPRRGIKA